MATFVRNSTAYLRNGTLVNSNLPRFEAGKFEQALMLEEGTTNLCLNSSFETDSNADGLSDNFNIWSTDSSRVMHISRPAALQHGSFSQRVENISVFSGVHSVISQTSIPVIGNTTYTMSCYVRTNVANKVYLSARFVRSNLSFIQDFNSLVTNITNQVVRLTLTMTTPNEAAFSEIMIRGINLPGEWMEIDAIQLEQKPYATSWQLGGTPRVGELLTVPTTGIVNPVEGSVEFVWQPINQPAGTMPSQHTSPQIVRMGTFNTNNSWVVWAWNSGLQLLVRGAGATGWTGQWVFIPGTAWYVLNRHYHIAVTWSNSNTFHVFVDGVQYGPYVSTHAFTGVAGNILAIGGSDQSGHTNALYDDLRISNRALSNSEILNNFQSNSPLFTEQNTTIRLPFNNNLLNTFSPYLANTSKNIIQDSLRRYLSPQYQALTLKNIIQDSLRRYLSPQYQALTLMDIISDNLKIDVLFTYNGLTPKNIIQDSLRRYLSPQYLGLTEKEILLSYILNLPPDIPIYEFLLPEESNFLFPKEYDFYV